MSTIDSRHQCVDNRSQDIAEKIMLSNENRPLVTVITPSWNSTAFLEQTILSVINQTYEKIEYIVIDGGSTDGTLEIIRKYENAIDYWVSEPDDGMYQAINKGMSRASGEIVAYLNSDDLYYPDTISKVVDFFADNPSADLVYGNLDFIDEKGVRRFTLIYPEFSWKRFVGANCSMIGQPAAFWRRSLLEKVGLFDESMKMAADFDFFIRAGRSGKLMYTPDVLAAFRTHSASLTSSQTRLGKEEVRRIHAKYLDSRMFFLDNPAKHLNYIYFKAINWRAMVAKLGMVLGKLINV